MDLSQLGNVQIIRLLKGNEDALQARNQSWQAYKGQNGPGSYGAFSSKFSSVFDPRVFQSQYMGAPEFRTMLKAMAPGEQTAFANKLGIARQSGWVAGPGSLYNGQ